MGLLVNYSLIYFFSIFSSSPTPSRGITHISFSIQKFDQVLHKNCSISLDELSDGLHRQVDVIYTDLEKAFNHVDHKLLTIALDQLGFSNPILLLFTLTNRSQFTEVYVFSQIRYQYLQGTPQIGHLS